VRFYALETAPVTVSNGAASTPAGIMSSAGSTVGTGRYWTSFPNGSFDAKAQDIVFDMQIVPANNPSGATIISVHGVSIEDLRQAKNFKGSTLSLTAGMQGGLPLSANQPKPELLITSTVFGAFGNWEGTEQTLDFVVIPSLYTDENPGNIVFSWSPGQTFTEAITATLSRAYPASTVSVTVNPSLSLPSNQPVLHKSSTSTGLAHFIHRLTYGALGQSYHGVKIYFVGSQITVTDYSSSTSPVVTLKFTDLIGQPTWLDPPVLTINTILRADIKIGGYIKLPVKDIPGPGSVLTSPTISGAVFSNKVNFSGTFVVVSIRAVGQFRGTGADSWLTVIQAVPVAAQSSGGPL
jgi:hypothetical protein